MRRSFDPHIQDDHRASALARRAREEAARVAHEATVAMKPKDAPNDEREHPCSM
jgi:hypothetical protein